MPQFHRRATTGCGTAARAVACRRFNPHIPTMIANTAAHKDYYAVIFSSLLSDNLDDYNETADHMMELAAQQPGFLGVESARSGLGITVSYWKDEASIAAWRQNAEHSMARAKGRSQWYKAFCTRVCKVEREYSKGL